MLSTFVKNLNWCVIFWTVERHFFSVVKSETNCITVLCLVETTKPVCLVLPLLTSQLAGFPAPIPFRLAYFCHAFPVAKHPRNRPARNITIWRCWITNLNLDVLSYSIVENLTQCLYFDPYGLVKIRLKS